MFNRKKTLSGILSVLLAWTLLFTPPASAFAEAPPSAVISADFSYTSLFGSHEQRTDRFVWDETWFTRSSFELCPQLALLSAQTALTSTCVLGNDRTDPSDDADNLIAMLNELGFRDIETNRYYTRFRMPDSCAVAVARRDLTADGKPFTLLVIALCSGGYGPEWAGNFRVGEDGLHEGFRLARDEVLRFLRQYVERHGISGDLKVWIAGHSRGGAVSGLVGGFLAGGGAAYLNGVRLAPEDLYVYTFAAPNNMQSGVSAEDALSVSGARSGVYADDTPGEPWTCPGSGIIRPDDSVYGGIHNIRLQYDLIASLPPEAWGLTRYGSTISQNFDGALDCDAMALALQSLYPAMYESFTHGGDWREVEPKAFDLFNLQLVRDPLADASFDAAAFTRRLADGFASLAADRTAYVRDGTQEILRAVAGLYGTTLLSSPVEMPKTSALIRPAVLFVLACAIEQMEAEGWFAPDASDADKAATVVSDLVSWLTQVDLDPSTATLDDLCVTILSWLFANEDTPLCRLALTNLAAYMESTKLAVLIGASLSLFVPDAETATMGDELRAFLRALVDGPEPGVPAAGMASMNDPETLRSLLFSLTVLAGILPWGTGAHTTLSEAAEKLIADQFEGAEDKTLIDAADAAMCDVLDLMAGPLVEDTAALSGDLYAQASQYLETVKAHAGDVRRMLLRVLLYGEGGTFSIDALVRSIATLAGNIGVLPLAHYNETSVSWSRVWLDAEAE